ncbi:MAG TPA: DUF1707 domain-containing protein [Micromonosporaceae bacterium]|nr:DUF1707 domain-containing protein [Micromonosporaceae bacterium]
MLGASGVREDTVTERREYLRAADADRESVAQELKGALDEGRLTLSEYDERLRDAYAAKTYGELESVLADLPRVRPAGRSQLASVSSARDAGRGGASEGPGSMPRWLGAVWRAWIVAVSINLVIWLLVSVSAEDGPVHFWPMWVAGPWGAVLLATTVTELMAGEPRRRRTHRSTDQ